MTMNHDNGDNFDYGQTPALPISEEYGSEVTAYLLSVRQEALSGPPVTFVANRKEVPSSELSANLMSVQHVQVCSGWSNKLLDDFMSIKNQLKDVCHIPRNHHIPKTTADWRKYLLQEPPEIGYFFTTLDRLSVFKLIAHITRWLSINSRPTLSQWVWKIFLRIDNTLDANECSTIRDLGKKAYKTKLKQVESDKDVDAISKYTVDMVLVIVGKYYGQLDLLQVV